MGSGIAAQVANAGYPVVLLDIKVEGRDLAAEAVQKMLKTEPAPFMVPSNASLITTGNLKDDLELISDCDWIIEVVLEDLKIKHQTYEKLNSVRKKGSVVSSNTSTIPLALLVEGQGKEFAKDFLITHFFNPPRYMRLLEFVTSKDTRKDAAEAVRDFCDRQLGKGVVVCKDTPGFIANRLGVFWMQAAVNEAVAGKVAIEVADAVMGKPIGVPKTAVFGLIDLVGIDLMPKLADSMLSTLPKDDEYRQIYQDHDVVGQMIEAGYTGRKGKGGFYRLKRDGGKKEKQVYDLTSAAFSEDHYYKEEKPKIASVDAGRKGLKAVVTTEDEGGYYAWKVLSRTLSYAASLLGEIAETVFDIDEAMRLGYNWKFGPFEMIDKLGAAWFAEKLKAEGLSVPEILEKIEDQSFYKTEKGKLHYFGLDGKYHQVKRPEGVLLLHDIKLSSEPVAKNGSASLWDIGDGVLCFEQTSKMNTFDEQTFAMLDEAIKRIEGSDDYKAMVIYNEASHFSAGANLGLALFMINIAMFPQVEQFIAAGQQAFMKVKQAPFPVVAAPSGLALGGGCEILLASDAIQAHAETYCGLVEVGVGVIPGWGGCKEMILRLQEREKEQYAAKVKEFGKDALWFSPDTTPMGAVRKAFEAIGMAAVAKSAYEAKNIGYFRNSDGVTMNRDRLLYDAKQRALKMVKGYQAPEERDDVRLPGPSGKMALDMAVGDMRKSGKATPYDVVVAEHLARVLSGGDQADWTKPLSESDILKLELEQFSALIRNEGTMKRIEHMLDTGKPLRN